MRDSSVPVLLVADTVVEAGADGVGHLSHSGNSNEGNEELHGKILDRYWMGVRRSVE